LETERLQSAVDGGGAHRQELAARQRLQAQRTFGLECGNELGEERRQALATQPAARLSAQARGADYDGRIDACATAMPKAWRRWTIAQQPNGVLAVIARGCTELVE